MTTELMYKIWLMGCQKDKIKTLDILHNNGIVHLNSKDDLIYKDKLLSDIPLNQNKEIAENILDMKWASNNLKRYIKLKNKNYYSGEKLDSLLLKSKEIKEKVNLPLSDLIKRLNVIEEDLLRIKLKIDFLRKVPGSEGKKIIIQSPGKYLFNIFCEEEPINYIDYKNREDNSIHKILNDYKVNIVSKNKVSLIQGLNKDFVKIEKKLKESNYKILQVPDHLNSLKEETKRYHDKRLEMNIIILQIKKIANKFLLTINSIITDLGVYHERYEATSLMLRTENIFVLEGFVSKRDYYIIEKIAIDNNLHLIAEEPVEAPSKIWNIPYIKSYEFMTKMFGYPTYKTFDPTPFLAFFFPLFFGFMFSDVGYGLILFVLSVLFLFKSNKLFNTINRDIAIIGITCSILTIFFGFLFGAFFGNLIKINPLLFDSFLNAEKFLVISLLIGLFHINLGIILSVFYNLKNKYFKSFIFDNLSIIILQIGLIMLFFGLFINSEFIRIGFVYFIISLLLFFIKSSFRGLFEVTGFIGTWFSYARLLALSFATAGIALGINIIADKLYNISLLGPLLFVIILIVGHLFNFLMNFLGSTIHSIRLHYIEFFSQFYKSGGKPFIPYTARKIKDTF
jgi:vacuolar-type H+-ATPase subunit I/STV1